MKTMLSCLLIVCCLCMAADSNDIQAQSEEIVQMVKELPNKKKALNEKVYTGTIEQVIQQRIADVNDVITYSRQIEVKADNVLKASKTPVKKDQAIRAVIQRYNDRKQQEQQKRHNDFIKAVNGVLNDPNTLPAADDPNYVDEVRRRDEIMSTVLEVTSPR